MAHALKGRRGTASPAKVEQVAPQEVAQGAASTGSLSPSESVLVEMLGQAPITFHRPFVDVAGSVTAALWLSAAVDLSRNHPLGRTGEFTLSQDDCQALIGLSRREQETARRQLRDRGLLVELKHGRKVIFQLQTESLANRVLEHCMGALKAPESSNTAPQISHGRD